MFEFKLGYVDISSLRGIEPWSMIKIRIRTAYIKLLTERNFKQIKESFKNLCRFYHLP